MGVYLGLCAGRVLAEIRSLYLGDVPCLAVRYVCHSVLPGAVCGRRTH